MIRIIDKPAPTLDEAFDFATSALMPAVPAECRHMVMEFAKLFHSCGALWASSLIAQRGQPSSCDEAEKIMLQVCHSCRIDGEVTPS